MITDFTNSNKIVIKKAHYYNVMSIMQYCFVMHTKNSNVIFKQIKTLDIGFVELLKPFKVNFRFCSV